MVGPRVKPDALLAPPPRGEADEDQGDNDNLDRKRGTGAEYLTARIARDHPEIHERLKRSEFRSVRVRAVVATRGTQFTMGATITTAVGGGGVATGGWSPGSSRSGATAASWRLGHGRQVAALSWR